MNEGTLIKAYLDEFSSVIMNLKSVDTRIDSEDLVLIALCSLLLFYDTFIDTLL